MIDFGKWAFANRKLVYFVVAVLLVGGILSAYDMSKLEDPEIKVKLAMVIATRPGASAHEMELEVTDPLEKNIRTMGEVESVTSSSFNDLAILEVELKKHGARRRRRTVLGHAAPQGFRRPAAIAVGNVGRRAGRLRTGLRNALCAHGRRSYGAAAVGLCRPAQTRAGRSGRCGACRDLRRTRRVHRHFDPARKDGDARRQSGRGAGDAQRAEQRLLCRILRQRARPHPRGRRRQVPRREGDREHGHPGARGRPAAVVRHRARGARLRRTRAQRDVLRGAACARHRRRGGFGQRHRQGRGRGGTLSGRVAGRALPCGSRLPQDFLPARAGQGCAGDVSDKPDRVGGDRRGHSDAYDGFPQRNDHRHQSGGDRRGIVPDSGDGRRNDAARVAGGVHPGHGNAGRQCHRDRGRHPDRPETRETAPRGDDGHRPEDGDAAAGRDADRHPFVPADLPLARYGGCLRARSVHRAGRVAAAELGAGAGACAAHGRRLARSACRSGRRRDALRQRRLPLAACGARLRPAASLVVDRRGARAGGAERLGLRLHASGLLPRYGLRPALYGVQTARGDEFDPREGRFGGDPPLFEETVRRSARWPLRSAARRRATIWCAASPRRRFRTAS